MYIVVMEWDESYVVLVFFFVNLYVDEENWYEEVLCLLCCYQQLELEVFKGYDMMVYFYFYSDQLEVVLFSVVCMYELDGGFNYSNDYLVYIYFGLGCYEEVLFFMVQCLQYGLEEVVYYLELVVCQV